MERSPTPERLLTLLGGFPDRSPLKAKILEEQGFETYTRRLIEYTTEGDERVQAYLLVPDRARARPLPGILAIHQDGAHRPYEFGKSEPAGVAGDPELAYGLELCLRGYVVICPDRFPFESRSLAHSRFREIFSRLRIFTEKGLELTEDLYRGAMENRLLLEGWTLPGMELFELQRALDCLCEQAEVDDSRLGAIGHSAGGSLVAFLMYLDSRVKAGCASCGTWLSRWSFNKDTLRPINGLAGFVIPGLHRWGDTDDILAGLAPRPFLETRGDPITPEQEAALTGKARARYAELGVSEQYEYVSYGGGHLFRRDMRERSYAWLDRWLKGQEGC